MSNNVFTLDYAYISVYLSICSHYLSNKHCMIAVWYENNVGIDAGIHYWTSENDSYAFLIVYV